jgi:hypothetical protein
MPSFLGFKSQRGKEEWLRKSEGANAATDNCDAAAIRAAYNITDESVPREEAYGYKYLLDVDGNSFSGRYLGLLRSGGLVFKVCFFFHAFCLFLVPFCGLSSLLRDGRPRFPLTEKGMNRSLTSFAVHRLRRVLHALARALRALHSRKTRPGRFAGED